jgi:DNA processing protein
VPPEDREPTPSARERARPPPNGWPERFVAGPVDRDALLVLAHLDGITPRRLHALAWEVGSARRCLAAVRRGTAGSEGDRSVAGQVSPDEVRATLARLDAGQVCPGDHDYPVLLLDLPDPPACLFVVGNSPAAAPVTVAIVGARRCSTYGREVAEMLGRGLAAAGVTVVSGAALGIDAAAHRGALSSAGATWTATPEPGFPTMAVLGSGIDCPHPSSNRGLIQRIAAAGAVLSEYPPGTPALPWRFPARNRLVAGLSRAVVVVEGAPGSGSMITAEFALELGRDVFAVPGPVTSPLSAVPNQLIREGAWLARGSEDILEVLGLDVAASRIDPSGEPSAMSGAGAASSLPATERRVLEAVAGHPVTADAVATHAGLPVGEALSALVALELRGLVREVAGRYERTAAAARP